MTNLLQLTFLQFSKYIRLINYSQRHQVGDDKHCVKLHFDNTEFEKLDSMFLSNVQITHFLTILSITI